MTEPVVPFIVDPENSTVLLVLGRETSLRCDGYGVPVSTFQWLKVRALNSHLFFIFKP